LGRTGAFQRLEPTPSVIAQALQAVSPQFSINLRSLWEAANNRWNQWVLNYSQSKQLDLLRNIGFESPSWEDLGYVLIGIVVTVSLLGAGWAQWERHRQDPWLRLLHLATQRLKASGLQPGANTGPRQLAAHLQAHMPAGDPHTTALCQWLLRLEAWRYAPAQPASTRAAQHRALATLQREYRRLPWPARKV
jgi:hypothetical protein